MRIVPKAILENNRERNTEVAFKEYRTTQDMNKVKIMLTHHVLVFLTNGEKVIHTANKTITFGSSTIFIIRKGNYLMAERLLKEQDYYESTLFFFSDEQLHQFITKYKLPKTVGTKDKVIEIPSNNTYHDWLKAYQQHNEKSPIAFEVMELKLEELFLQILQNEEDAQSLFFGLLEKPVNLEFLQLIDSKMSQSINLEELAFLSSMSLSTFKRKFKEEFGMAAGTFIRKRKLEVAMNKIASGEATGSELYYELGYESHSSFITAFKKEYGVTPDDYSIKQQD